MVTFLVLAQATASDQTNYAAGNRHAVLVYAVADTIEAAAERTLTELPVYGWVDVEVRRYKPLVMQVEDIEDHTLRRAATQAAREGFAYVVYSLPAT